MIKSPFKFLDAYTLEDREIFFGRDQEITELYRKVFESKLLLVYGISGTGKSSLINCGLASRFDESDWLPVNVRRGSNIIDSLNEAINKQAISPLKKNLTVSEKLQSIYLDHFKPVYLIFDQFEELFIFGNQEERSIFIKLIKDISDSKIQCRIIFILREEFLAGMTDFRSELPKIFDNCFRVEKMKSTNAISAVEGPCKVNNIETEAGFSEELIDKLCPSGIEIELTFLQIYLDRIFRIAEISRNKDEKLKFSKELLIKAGSVSDLLGQFLEEQIREFDDPDTGMAILKSFVSVQGTKRQMNELDILDAIKAFGTEISEPDLIKYLTKFVDLRILKEKDESGHFELRHDALAAKIYEKFTSIEKDIIEVRQFIDNEFSAFEKRGKLLTAEDLNYITPYEDKLFLNKQSEAFINKSKSEITKTKRRRRAIVFAAAIAFIIVLLGFTLWALSEKQKSNQNYLKARANSFNFLSQKVVESDPTIALRLTEYALSLDPANPNIVENLNGIYSENNFYRIISRHESAVESVVFSPDGRSILTGSYDKTARLLDLQGNVLQVFKGHQSGINSVAFSPDGNSILTGSDDKTAILWDLHGNVLQVFKGHVSDVNSIAFSPDGKSILTGSKDKTARLWNLQRDVLTVLKGHESDINSVAFSPDGKSILTGSKDNTARLWNLKGNLLQIFKGHESSIMRVAFAPDGKSILTGSLDKTARQWDLHGNLLQVFKGSTERIISIAFSPDGNSILTGSMDKIARLWDLNGNVLQFFKGHESEIHSVAFSPDGKSILTGSKDNTVGLWNLQKDVLQEFKGHEDGVLSVVFSPNSNSILTGSFDKTARLWDLHGNLIQMFRGHKSQISSVAFSPDGKSILTGSDDKTACLWDIQGNLLQVFKGHESGITSVTFSADGKSILTGSWDKTACLWDLHGNVQQMFKGHDAGIRMVAISSDGKRILTGSLDDFTARLWNLQGNSLHVFNVPWITSLSFSPDGNRILTGSFDGTVRLWDLEGYLLQLFKGSDLSIASVAFSPDGKSILTGSYDNTARLWDLHGNALQVFTGHKDFVNSAVFSPDGKYILTGSWDKIARLWAIKKGLKEFQRDNSYQELSISQKIKFGVLEFNNVLKLEDENSLYEATEYYYGEINSVGKDKRTEYLNNTANLINNLVTRYKKTKYIIPLLNIYELLQGTTPNKEIRKKVDKLNNELFSFNDPEELLDGAIYFFNKGRDKDNLVNVSYLQKSVLLYERIMKEFPEKDVKKDASIAYNNLSFALLFIRQFGEALKYAQKGVDMNNDAVRNTKLALGYLFNDQYDEALKIIENYKNSIVNGKSFKEYIRTKLDDLEKEGITNADAKKIREELQK